MRTSSAALFSACLAMATLAAAQGSPVATQGSPMADSAMAAARTLGEEGQRAYESGDYKTAKEQLSRAFGVVRIPTVGLSLARSLVKLGELVAASERYDQVTCIEQLGGKVSAQKEAQEQAAQERAELMPRIPKVTVHLLHANATEVQIQVDGNAIPAALLDVPIPADPGARTIEGRFGSQVLTREVTLAEGQSEVVVLEFEASAPPAIVPTPAVPPAPSQHLPAGAPRAPKESTPPTPVVAVVALPPTAPGRPEDNNQTGSAQRTAGWVLTGVGIAGVTVWGVTAIGAYGLEGAIQNRCHAGVCDSSVSGSVNTYNALLHVSTAAFWVGLVGVVSGTTLLVTAPRKREERELSKVQATPWVGIGSLGVKGKF